MAITITQQPTSPNAAYTRLVYVISGSSNTTAPQFEYVMDVYESGSTNLISRVTQTVNPAGVSVFDPSRIIQGQLDYENNWKITGSIVNTESFKTFDFRFGEQYGTSISSSVTVYPGTGSNYLDIFPASVNPNEGSYNFNSSSYNFGTESRIGNDTGVPGAPFLNTFPLNTTRTNPYFYEQPIAKGDYGTISLLKQDWYCYEFGATNTYNILLALPNNVYVFVSNLPIPVPQDYTTTDIFHIGVGPENIKNYTLDANPYGYTTVEDVFNDDWQWYGVGSGISSANLPAIEAVGFAATYYNPGASLIYNTYSDKILVDNPRNEYTRFAFINKNGVWDYFNVFNPVRRSSDIQRENVTLSRVDYSSILSPYDITRRGDKSYYVEHTDRFTVDTQLLDQVVANWLEELLESPSVFIQRGDDFIPVVITNNSYRHNNETSRNKLFKYTIEFEPANQPFGEWVPQYIEQYCATPTPSPSPSPTPSPTPTPSITPTLTPTPTFTPTPTPSATPLPPVDSFRLNFRYDSKDAGVSPSTYWEDSLSVGPDLTVRGTTTFITGASLPILTGSVYDMGIYPTSDFFAIDAIPEIRGSGVEVYSWQFWVRLDSGSLDNDLFYIGGESINCDKMDFVRVVTKPSGSQAVLGIGGVYSACSGNQNILQTFPSVVLEPDTWYQVTLTRNGNNFTGHKLYLDTGSANSPTGSYNIEMGTYYNNDVFRVGDEGTYLSQVLYYKDRELNTTAIAQNYNAIKSYLQTEL